jgi:hypothetical protein
MRGCVYKELHALQFDDMQICQEFAQDHDSSFLRIRRQSTKEKQWLGGESSFRVVTMH